jgi:cytochrome c5
MSANGFVFGLFLACSASALAQTNDVESVDHSRMIREWNAASLNRGRELYDLICVTCHGTPEKEGTLPTSRAFWKEPFKNGSDPYSIYKTLRDGFGQMPAWPSLTPQRRYDVIHYLREEFLKRHNSTTYFPITSNYLASLPQRTSDGPATREVSTPRTAPYLRMDFGATLNWTYQISPGNLAMKGIAIRLDHGPGGISKGRHWVVYDHDTMRLAAGWSGDKFIDWRGIAFDGSHGTHSSIAGDITFALPPGPGWANPKDGTFTDPRPRGADGKPYGPLPREWLRYQGMFQHDGIVALRYSVGSAEIIESPSILTNSESVAFTRRLNIASSRDDLHLRIAPAGTEIHVESDKAVRIHERDGLQVLQIPAAETPAKIVIALSSSKKLLNDLKPWLRPEDLTPLLKGGAPKWNLEIQTTIQSGSDQRPFTVETLSLPPDEVNPWKSWMRLSGFDFFPGGDTAAVCTWLGEVWLVRGVGKDEHLRWKRIAAGLFQPLGLKIVDDKILVSCRDQIVRLHDFNADEEIDFYENFNSDHQVTEHFHEFAMGLQTDRAGNFYYAKSARHALPPIVPHHGTLLRVAKDGSRTDIVASGFRAANGVCVNDDGTFFVTDQEGHWIPKNRINHVIPGRFYGNMWSYLHPESSADSAMEQPLVWITNEMDRSPGELVRVTSDRWGALKGALLNLSYGTGRIFVVPHETIGGQAQGGVVRLPIPDLPTGVMRGRFHEKNGALYACGMVAWASNKTQDGGFYRVRPTANPAYLPIQLHAWSHGMELTFTEPLNTEHAQRAENYTVRTWDLKRSENYGSKHLNEKQLQVTSAALLSDRKTVRLELAGFKPTWCMEIRCKLLSRNGELVDRVIHNTVHTISASE